MGPLPQKKRGNNKSLLHHRLFAFFASLKLTVVILTVLLLGLLVGMFWDQTLTLEEHLISYSKTSVFAQFFIFFELDDVFHSWWFSIIVLLLALNLIACSIERLPKIWIDIHHPERILTERLLKKLPHQVETIIPFTKAMIFIKNVFPEKSYRICDDDAFYVFHEKHKYARTGVYVVHIALLMIMFGSMTVTNLGIDGMMMIVEGEKEHTVRVKGPGGLPFQHQLDFNVVCRDFRLKSFVDGSPMAFESDLAIFNKNDSLNPLVSQTIRVNEPLQYAGYTFYQASYQPMSGDSQIRLSIGPHGGARKNYVLPIGAKAQMSDQTALIPIEVIDDYGGLGEAVKIQQVSKDGRTTSFVVFRQYPDFDPMVRRGEWDVYFQGFDQVYATGVSVARVPFIEVVFLGFVLMFIGLFMAFRMSHRRYFACVKKTDNDQCELTFAGIARRHPQAFADEFQKLTKWIEP